MNIKSLVLALTLLTAGLAGQGVDDFKPGDPARVGKTGKPQLVEFYHQL